MKVSFKQRPQAARATTKSSDVTHMMYASRAVPMAARIPVVVSIELADGRSGSALYSGLYGRLERVNSSPHGFTVFTAPRVYALWRWRGARAGATMRWPVPFGLHYCRLHVCWGGLPPGVAFSLWEGVCRHATPCDLGARHDGVMKDTDPTRSYDIFTYCAPRSCSVSSSWNSKKGWPWLPPRATREKLCVLFMPSCPPL